MPYKVTSTGRWAAQGRDANGKRVQLGTFATKREAQKAEDNHKRRRPGGDTTVAEWREHWLKVGDWADSTRAHHAERTKRFTAEHGKKRLVSINRTIARAFVADYPSCHQSLSAMFGAAMYEDDEHGDPLLTVNPFSKLVKNKTKKRDLQSEWMLDEDVAAIEETALRTIGAWAAGFVRFAAEEGIRPGELFALGESDLNPEAGVLLVRWAADSKTRTLKRPKNGQAREIVLSRRALEAARSLIEARDTGWRQVRKIENDKLRAAATAAELEPTPLIFTNPHGDQFWNNTWAYYWHQIRAAAGRPDMDFYELRHYCATRLLEGGLSERDVAEQLGHTDGGELVRKVYGHPSKRRALDRVRAVLDDQEEE